jgi:BirA family biotin operon repressor/biotin-[acetyl-CoA-carboxylase] ligase
MDLIKLDAIDSTNDFLKRLNHSGSIKNWTVVVADSQLSGKGQMGSQWFSEKGKNITMSILVNDLKLKSNQIFSLNAAVSLAIIKVLHNFSIPNLSVKWPNDIMSDSKKIGGILIENIFKSHKQIISIIGIGLNVNQTNFANLPKASSLSIIKQEDFDKDLILKLIFDEIQINFLQIQNQETESIWKNFNQNLFKKQIPMAFEKANGQRFMALIQEVDQNGKLVLQLQDDSFETFETKEVQMLY